MKPKPTKSEMEAFIKAGFTVADIAVFCGWTTSKVRYWLKKYNFQAVKEKGSVGAKAFKALLQHAFPAYPIEEEKYIEYGLRLDFYIPGLYTAFEVDGDPHHETVPLFHGGDTGYKKALRRDELKDEWCKKNNILLIRVTAALAVETMLSPESREAVISEIRNRIAKEKPTGPIFEEKKPIQYNEYREKMKVLSREARKKSYRKAKALKDKLKQEHHGNALKDD